ASLMLDGWISRQTSDRGGPDPFVFHLTSVLLHAICCILLLHLGRRCGIGMAPAFLIALLFAVHPVQVQSVSWVSHRKAVLAPAFAVGSMTCYLRFGRSAKVLPLVFSVALFIFATLAKPNILPLVAVFPLLDIWPLGVSPIRQWRNKLPFIAVA